MNTMSNTDAGNAGKDDESGKETTNDIARDDGVYDGDMDIARDTDDDDGGMDTTKSIEENSAGDEVAHESASDKDQSEKMDTSGHEQGAKKLWFIQGVSFAGYVGLYATSA